MGCSEVLSLIMATLLNWGDPDRLFAGVQLVKARKSELLIFTRGQMPWSTETPEGEILREKAMELGILPK